MRNDNFAVVYMDWTVCSEQTLAINSERAYSYKPFYDSRWILLKTCHRLELYTTEAEKAQECFDGFWGEHGILIKGRKAVFERLVSIIIGCKSKIIGERFIVNQVKQAIRHSIANNNVKQLFEDALKVGETIRQEYNYYNKNDYNNIAVKLLNCKNNSCITNIVIGGGVLARRVFEDLIIDNISTIIITRNPHKLKKTFTFPHNYKHHVYTIDNAINKFKEIKITCFIATNNVDTQYNKKIVELINNNAYIKVIDFSAIPVFEQFFCNYVTMYSDEFEKEIIQNNLPFIKKTKEIQSAIKHFIIDKLSKL